VIQELSLQGSQLDDGAPQAEFTFRTYYLQTGSNPESHKLSGQVLINAVPGQAGPGTKMSCWPTKQAQHPGCPSLGRHPHVERPFLSHACFPSFDADLLKHSEWGFVFSLWEFVKADQEKEEYSMKRASFVLVAVTLLGAVGMGFTSRAQTQNQPPSPARSRSDEMLERWNDIGNKLVAMARDFPEDKYDFKVQKDERTFAQNLLHAAALDFVLIRRVSGTNVGPDFGEGDNPSRDVFKSKADVVKFVQEAVADGAQVIQQQGDAGLDKTSKFFGNRMAHNSNIWTFAIEHSGEHYGQLVVYYRANNLVPPDSRR
jgi:uncharacterized damage-inducible protein DinB